MPLDQVDATAVPVLPDLLEKADLRDLQVVLELLDYVVILEHLDLRDWLEVSCLLVLCLYCSLYSSSLVIFLQLLIRDFVKVGV